MSLPNNYFVSVEAIAFQTDEKLYKEMIAAIANLRSGDITEKRLVECGLTQAINARTNITLIPHLDSDTVINAKIQPPSIDKNHPLLQLKGRNGANFHGSIVIKYVKEKIGYVDLATSKVHGAYAKLGFHMFICAGLLDKNNTDEEVASLLLHELGHIYTYFEYLGTVVSTNYAMATAVAEALGVTNKPKRVEILSDIIDELKLDVNANELADETNAETVQIVLSDAFVKKQRSMLGSDIYDMTGWEFLSDQFAVRHGAGRALVTILDKAYRNSGYSSYRANSSFLAMEALKVATMISAHILTAGVTSIFYILVAIFYNPMSDVYDRPRDRTSRIKLQVIEALKDPNLSRPNRERYIDDLKVIEQIESEMKNRRTVFQFVCTTLVPSVRRQWKQTVLQKKLEDLSSNPIFVSAAKLNNLDL